MMRRNNFTIGLFIAILWLTGCEPEAVDTIDKESTAVDTLRGEATVEVYKYDGSLKCVGGGMDIDTMAEELTDNAVPVLAAYKDTDGYYHIETCGVTTGIINVYEINRDKLDAALAIGFMQLDELRENAGLYPET